MLVLSIHLLLYQNEIIYIFIVETNHLIEQICSKQFLSIVTYAMFTFGLLLLIRLLLSTSNSIYIYRRAIIAINDNHNSLQDIFIPSFFLYICKT